MATNLADRIEQDICGATKIKGYVTPHYRGLSIANLVASAAKNFGARIETKRLAGEAGEQFERVAKDAKKVVYFLVDGLGWEQLKWAADKDKEVRKVFDKLAAQGATFPLTSVFPSATVAGYTTTCTGLPPLKHGLLDYQMYVKEVGTLVNVLRFSPLGSELIPGLLVEMGVEPRRFFGAKTVFERLKGVGAKPIVITRERFLDTPFSQMLHFGAQKVGYENDIEVFSKLRSALRASKGKTYILAYWDGIDVATHEYGPYTAEALAQIKWFAANLQKEFLDKLTKAEARDTLLILAADHGQIYVTPKDALWLDFHAELVSTLMIAPAGGMRESTLFVRPERLDAARKYCQRHLSTSMFTFETKAALKLGLWGEGKPKKAFLERVGQLQLIPKKTTMLLYPYLGIREFSMRGFHGGLLAEEMLVPCVLARLG